MKKHLINIIAIVGLVATIIIQLMWLYNSFRFVKNELSLQVSDLLNQAIYEETLSRCYKLPIGTPVKGKGRKERKESFPEYVYMNISLEELGVPLSLDSVGDIWSRLLKDKGIVAELNLVENRGGIVVKSLKEKHSHVFTLKTKDFPMKKNYSVVISGSLRNTGHLFLERLGGLLLSTTLLMIFIIGYIVFQIQTIRKQKQILRMREDFSYAMIHDMKTPLSSIAMVLNFIRSGRLDNKPEMKDKYCRIAEEETERLLALTNKVLTISKLEAHKMSMSRTMVELRPLVDKLVGKFSVYGTKRVQFMVELKEPYVYADAEYLEEMLVNLIDNSIKYSKEEVNVRISSQDGGQYTIVSVYDDGWGISYKDRQAIFNKYERAGLADRKQKKEVSGFGLGLNFVWQVMEAHEGKVMVNSIKDEFSEFMLFLPKQKTEGHD